MTAQSLEEARRRRDAIRGAVEEGVGRGRENGVPLEDLWSEALVNLGANVDGLTARARELSEKVDRLSNRIEAQSGKVAALAESVAAMERRLKHVPSIWSMLAGQVLTACTVAGLLIVAFDHGWTISKGRALTTQAAPATGSDAGKQ